MFLVVLLLALVFLLILYDVWKPKKFPPGIFFKFVSWVKFKLKFSGPPWLPLVGNFTHFRSRLKILGYHHLVWAELTEKFGSVVGLKMGRNLVVTVSGPEAVKEILSRDEFDGRPDGFFFRLRTFGKRLGVYSFFVCIHIFIFLFYNDGVLYTFRNDNITLMESVKIFIYFSYDVSISSTEIFFRYLKM